MTCHRVYELYLYTHPDTFAHVQHDVSLGLSLVVHTATGDEHNWKDNAALLGCCHVTGHLTHQRLSTGGSPGHFEWVAGLACAKP